MVPRGRYAKYDVARAAPDLLRPGADSSRRLRLLPNIVIEDIPMPIAEMLLPEWDVEMVPSMYGPTADERF